MLALSRIMRCTLAGKFGRLGSVMLLAGACSLAVACGDASDNTGSTWHSNGGHAGSGTPAGNNATSSGGSSSGGSTSGGSSSGGSTSGGSSSGGSSSGGSSSGASGSSGTAAPAITVTLGSVALKGDLMTDQQTVVTVAPSNGFTGTVTLAVSTVTGITTKLDKTTLDITGAAAASAMLTATSSKVGDVPFTITATATALAPVTTNVTFSATSNLTLYIPADAESNKGTQGAPYNTAFGPAAGVVVHGTPIKLTIVNKDGTGHIIHGDGKNGFAHGDTNNPLGLNAPDKVRTLTAAASYSWYLHDQGSALVTGKLVIQQ